MPTRELLSLVNMIYKTENQIKMTLGLNAWRNLLQEKVVRFAQMTTDMDPTVMMELMGELPQLRDFARQTLSRIDQINLAAPSQQGLAAAHRQSENSWGIASSYYRKVLALDFLDGTADGPAKDKMQVLDTLLPALADCQDLYTFDEQFLRDLCRRNQDSLRSYIIASLVYIGGCLQPPVQDEYPD